jgi:hypothetical protein
MSKTRKKGHRDTKTPSGKGMSFRDYNPAPINPLTTQFEPTPESPIRRGAKQAGVA